jgi:squalene-hopene/tetraprenyl-beta-curcumene cyclase
VVALRFSLSPFSCQRSVPTLKGFPVMKRIMFFAVLLLMLTTRLDATRTVQANGWDQVASARYLDERMELWFTKAKKLRTGTGETMCVSCHTTVPYVLARPALRRAMHVTAATPHELRIVQEVTRRVESYDAQQPLYDHTDSKKTESRGTEAVLNALILANSDAASSRITQRAFQRLWETQRSDGMWDWLDFGLEPFETTDGVYYGATLAALSVGSHHQQATEAKAGRTKLRGYLQEKYATQSLFNRTWLLLAATRWPALLTKPQRQALLAELQERQQSDGGWALQSLGPWHWSKTTAPKAPGTLDAALLARSDGYATGLIVYTMRQAKVSASHPAVKRGLQWLRTHQQKVQIEQSEWSAWRAHSLNFDREHGGDKGEAWRRMFMSDSATAFAALALLGAE